MATSDATSEVRYPRPRQTIFQARQSYDNGSLRILRRGIYRLGPVETPIQGKGGRMAVSAPRDS